MCVRGAVLCSVAQCVVFYMREGGGGDLCCSVLQCVAVCCSVLQCVAVAMREGGGGDLCFEFVGYLQWTAPLLERAPTE